MVIFLQLVGWLSAFALLFFLPGLFLFRAFSTAGRAESSAAEKLVLWLGLATFFVPAVLYLSAALLFVPLTWPLALLIAAICSAGGGWLARKTPWERPGVYFRQLKNAWRDHPWLYAMALFSFLYQFLFFDTVMDFHFTCTYFPCLLPGGHEFGSAIAGMPPFGQAAGANNSLYYAGHQRMGVTAVLSPALVLFGILGLRIQWGLIMAAVPLAVHSLATRLGMNRKAAMLVALVAALLPSLLLDPDQNRLNLSLTGVIALMVCGQTLHPLAVGFFLALLVGVEPLNALGFLALFPLGYLFRRNETASYRHLGWLPVGLAIGLAPFLLRYHLAFGSALTHEHFSYIPAVTYHFFGIPFRFPAFLNWPFRESLIRSFYNPFPNLTLLPLSIERHLGIPLLAFVLLGIYSWVRARRWAPLGAALLFFLPIAGFLAVNEDWTQQDKWSIVIMAYLPLLVLMGQGFSWFLECRAGFLRWLGLTFSLGLLVAWHFLLIRPLVPEDPLYRSLWQQDHEFMPPEEPFYLSAQRDDLHSPNWFPWVFEMKLPTPWNLRALKKQIADRSVFNRTPSMSELLMMMFAGPAMPAVLPQDANQTEMSRRYIDAPVLGSLSLSASPATGLTRHEGKWRRDASCSPEQLRLDLYPFTGPFPIRVPWQEEPIVVFSFIDETKGFGALTVLRTVRKADRAQLFASTPIENPCLLIHLPEKNELVLIDIVSMEPNRNFAYRAMFDPADRNKVALEFQYP